MCKEKIGVNDIICECIYGLCDVGERADIREFVKKTERSFKSIRRHYCSLQSIQKKDTLPVPLMWLWDNYYIMEGSFLRIFEVLKNYLTLPALAENPRLFVAARRYCRFADSPFDSFAISSLLSSMSSSCSLGLREYFCAREQFTAAYLAECCEILDEYCSIKKPTNNDNKVYGKKIENAVISLHKICEHNFNPDILKSRQAKILSKDPAGAFSNMTEESRLMYLQRVMEISEKKGMSDKRYAEWLLERAKKTNNERERHIGYPLFIKPKYNRLLYFSLLFTSTALLTLYFTIFVSPLCIFLVFPFFEITRICTDKLFSKFVKTFPLPRMETKNIKSDKAVLVVITSLFTGSADAKLFEKLENMYLACREENVYFGILGDLPDSKSATAPGDGDIIKSAYGRIDALSRKYGKNFVLLERRRSYSKSEEAFMGWERKRGAVTELVRFLRGGYTTFSEKSIRLAADVIGDGSRIKYIITLDSDTSLPIEAVRSMYGAMQHPLSKAYIDKQKGIVTQGYGIMQPRCAPEITSAGATPFTRLMCDTGGVDSYSSAAFDTFQSLFGEGIFCGKGIIDVDAFYEVIDKHSPFPEDRILSHDSLEGAYLRCALIGDLTLTDSFPKNTLSYEKRRHRWIRGDIQNLPYLFKKISIADKRTKNHINALSKYKLFLNASYAFLDISTYICIMASIFVSGNARFVLLSFSLLRFFLPLIFELFRLPKGALPGYIGRRFFSKGVCISITSELFRLLYNISSIATDCYFCLDAISRSLYRMIISQKKLLEWQTAAQSDSSFGGILMFVYKNMFSVISAFFILLLSDFPVLTLIAVMWLAFPVIAYHLSFDIKKGKNTLPCDDKKRLLRYSKDIWKYFSDFVTQKSSYLPPDNIMLSPSRTLAERTSPTNIGLYLLSALSARDLNLIDSSELYRRIQDTTSIIEKLEKYNGHLYNWYSTTTLEVLTPKYVSTVDSGNLTACLMTLCEGIADYASECTHLLELIPRIRTLINQTDYSFLYNSERNLYSLGAEINEDTVKISDGCFDLYMSEARIVSYMECASRKVPKKHWAALSRALITKDGYMGMTSWTGTAFEYFLPTLFLPIYKRSLCREALHFAFREQALLCAYSKNTRLFGISESCYNERYSDGNYKYRAFGIPSLGLQSGLGEHLVLSPYSSFLMLCINRYEATENLKRFEKSNFYGEYGFYEAVDFTPTRSKDSGTAVECFMAHHLGMSICAVANELCDKVHIRRFMRYGSMSCGEELLRERIPANAIIRRPRKRHDILKYRTAHYTRRTFQSLEKDNPMS